jgi:hypothetical protein
VKVAVPLRRAGICVTGFFFGYLLGAAHVGLLLSLAVLALTIACIEVTSRLTEEE